MWYLYLDYFFGGSLAPPVGPVAGPFRVVSEATGSRLRVETGPDRKDIKAVSRTVSECGFSIIFLCRYPKCQ